VPGQTWPQEPQLFGSVEVARQVPPQFVYPALHPIPQRPLTQIAYPFGGAGQALPHWPQLFTLLDVEMH
jgi:hypothetical protein